MGLCMAPTKVKRKDVCNANLVIETSKNFLSERKVSTCKSTPENCACTGSSNERVSSRFGKQKSPIIVNQDIL